MTQTNLSGDIDTINIDDATGVISFDGHDFANQEELNKHLVGKNKALTEQNKDLRSKTSSSAETRSQGSDDARFARLELKTEGYADGEIDFLLKNGGKDALKDPFVKSAVEAMREQRKAEQAITTGSGGSSTFGKYTQSEINKMSSEEYRSKVLGQ